MALKFVVTAAVAVLLMAGGAGLSWPRTRSPKSPRV